MITMFAGEHERIIYDLQLESYVEFETFQLNFYTPTSHCFPYFALLQSAIYTLLSREHLDTTLTNSAVISCYSIATALPRTAIEMLMYDY